MRYNKYSPSNENIKEFKIIDDVNNKENNEDESNNISTSNNDSNIDSKNIKLRNNPIKLQNDNQEILSIKIQSIWQAHRIQKRINFIKIVKNIIDKLSIIIKNKNKDNFSFFLGKIRDKKKNKNKSIKLKSQKHSKKVKGLNSLILGMDANKLNELIEKEKQYDILLAKYEEVMKELEKVKKEIENKKPFFNQNLNLIDNKNQNISINIFPNDTSKKIKMRLIWMKSKKKIIILLNLIIRCMNHIQK